MALRWSDIDLDAGRVRFARSLTVAEGEQHTGPTKTHAAREIALDELGVEVLERRWDDMDDLSGWAESPLVSDPFVLSYNANGAMPGQSRHVHASLRQTVREDGGTGAGKAPQVQPEGEA